MAGPAQRAARADADPSALARADPDGGDQVQGAPHPRIRGRAAPLDADLANCFEGLPPRHASSLPPTIRSRTWQGATRLEVIGAVIPSLSTRPSPRRGTWRRWSTRSRASTWRRCSRVGTRRSSSGDLPRGRRRDRGRALDGQPRPGRLGAETYVRAMRANADALVRGMTAAGGLRLVGRPAGRASPRAASRHAQRPSTRTTR